MPHSLECHLLSGLTALPEQVGTLEAGPGGAVEGAADLGEVVPELLDQWRDGQEGAVGGEGGPATATAGRGGRGGAAAGSKAALQVWNLGHSGGVVGVGSVAEGGGVGAEAVPKAGPVSCPPEAAAASAASADMRE